MKIKVAFVLVFAASLALGAYVVRSRSQQICGFCQRPINPQAGVMAEVGGRTRHVCCARCAVSEGLQEKKTVRLISVTDYLTGQRIDPQNAWFVDGSRVIACRHDMTPMGQMKRPEQLTFDRCSPGAFAFARRVDAETFISHNGGVLRNLDEMLAAVNGTRSH